MEDNKLSKEYRKTNNRHLSRAKQFYEDYIALGNLREVGKKHDITKSEVSRLFKRWHQKGFLKYSIKEMRIENIRNQLLKDYNNLINKLRRHPTTSEMLRDEEWKNIYHRIIYRYGSLSNFRKFYGYPQAKEISERKQALKARWLFEDYLTLGTLEKVAKKHRITGERARQILDEGDHENLFVYPVKNLGFAPSVIIANANKKEGRKIILRLKKDYDKCGSLKDTARRYNVSHETIRQILAKGDKIGLFEFPPKEERLYSKITKEKLYEAFIKCGSLGKLSKYYKVGIGEVKEAMKKHRISTQDAKFEAKRRKAIDAYQKLVKKLGHHPSVTEIIKEKKYLLIRINNIWGSVGNFRKSCGFTF